MIYLLQPRLSWLRPTGVAQMDKSMDDDLIAYALALILDDFRIGQWATGEVDKRLGRGPDDDDPGMVVGLYTGR